jgi:hypothetical protein
VHDNSLRLMRECLARHAPPRGRCYDVGSGDKNGTYRPLVEERGLVYQGLDIASGPNVDIVVPEHEFWCLPPAELVISGQCLEHTRRPWHWIHQVTELLLPGAPLVVIAPWRWMIHRYPLDCWRILPDGLAVLFDDAGLETLTLGTSENDTFGVARKPGAAPCPAPSTSI